MILLNILKINFKDSNMLKGYIYQGGARNPLKINFKESKLIYTIAIVNTDPNINPNTDINVNTNLSGADKLYIFC